MQAERRGAIRVQLCAAAAKLCGWPCQHWVCWGTRCPRRWRRGSAGPGLRSAGVSAARGHGPAPARRWKWKVVPALPKGWDGEEMIHLAKLVLFPVVAPGSEARPKQQLPTALPCVPSTLSAVRLSPTCCPAPELSPPVPLAAAESSSWGAGAVTRVMTAAMTGAVTAASSDVWRGRAKLPRLCGQRGAERSGAACERRAHGERLILPSSAEG